MRLPFYKSHHFLLSAKKIKCAGKMANSFTINIINEYNSELASDFNIKKEDMQKRIRAGDTCFALSDGTSFLGILWGHTGECFIKGVGKRLPLKNDEVYFYGVFTKPEARNRNVFSSLLNAFFRYYSEKYITKYYALVDVENFIMQQALQKYAFIVGARIFYLRIAGIGLMYEHGPGSPTRKLKVILKDPIDCTVI